MIKAVIFDYYGVVCPRITPCLAKETARQFGSTYENVLEIMDELLDLMDDNSITFYEYWKLLKKKLKNDNAKLSEHQEIWKKCALKLEIRRKMKILITRLKSQDYKVPVLSNVTRTMVKYNRMKGRYKIFKPVFLSCYIGLKKPSRDVFEYVLKNLKLKPEECIFIDDKKDYMTGAKYLGIKTILFKNVMQTKRELRGFGVHGI